MTRDIFRMKREKGRHRGVPPFFYESIMGNACISDSEWGIYLRRARLRRCVHRKRVGVTEIYEKGKRGTLLRAEIKGDSRAGGL